MKHKLLLGLLLMGLEAVTACAKPASSVRMEAGTERQKVVARPGEEVVVELKLTGGAAPDRAKRLPLNVAVVLDRSGSMEGAKIEKARQAASQLVDLLGPEDVFSLVIYDTEVEILVPAQKVTDKRKIKNRIEGITPRGSTALYAGVEKGAEQLQEYFSSSRINRVLLLSDGLANVGPSSATDLATLGRSLQRKGLSVSTIGLGDDYNENLMVALAESSAANYYYVKDTEKLPGIFAGELGQMQRIVARQIRIIIECPEGVKPVAVIGFPEVTFSGNRAEMEIPELVADQTRSILVRCRLTEGRKTYPSEMLQASMQFEDVRTGGKASQAAVACVDYTKDRDESDKSIQAPVAQQVAIANNREAKESALRFADQGDAEKAAEVLTMQRRANANLPAAAQNAVVAKDDATLEQLSGELKSKGELSKASRKGLQYENYSDKYNKRQ
jgi:Ca-activated chloride channel family protein